MELHPDELRADFQQYYGLNLDRMGADYSPEHAGALCAQLPRGARTMLAEDEGLRWGDQEAMLSSIEHGIRVLCWQNTKDGQKGRNAPKPVALPGSRSARSKIERTDLDFVRSVLGGPTNG